MGEILKVSCASCQAEWECIVGYGIQHGDLRRVARLYPDDIKQKIESYADGTEIPLFDFRFQLSVCEHCKSIVSVPVIHLRDIDTDYIGTCEKCEGKTKLIKSVTKTQCPICQETSLKEEDIGRWD